MTGYLTFVLINVLFNFASYIICKLTKMKWMCRGNFITVSLCVYPISSEIINNSFINWPAIPLISLGMETWKVATFCFTGKLLLSV